MALKTTTFDAAEYLDSDEAIDAYLSEAFESGNAAEIAHALGVVARARNMSALATQTNLTRETLYRALSPEGNPTLATLTAVTRALGFRLAIKRATEDAR
jgi:probable addiction module antidote protein